MSQESGDVGRCQEISGDVQTQSLAETTGTRFESSTHRICNELSGNVKIYGLAYDTI